MNNQFNRFAFLFGLGSLAAALTVLANWGIRETIGGGLALVTARPTLTTFYEPMVWGGIWGLLYLIPISNVKWFWKGMIFGLLPGLCTQWLRSGGLGEDIFKILAPDRLLRHDALLTMLAYVLVWGLVTAYCARQRAV